MASKRNIRRRVCSRKRQIATHDEAVRISRLMSSKHRQRIGYYKCTYGNHYHVGHTPARIARYKMPY